VKGLIPPHEYYGIRRKLKIFNNRYLTNHAGRVIILVVPPPRGEGLKIGEGRKDNETS
jgi:hypothetical protein